MTSGTAIIGAVAIAVAAAAGGFLAGRGSAGDDPSRSSAQNANSASTTVVATRSSEGISGERPQPNLRGYELSQNPRKGLKTLMAELKQSPMAQMDFESLFSIWDMVQYLDAYELEGLMEELEEMGGGQEVMVARMMMLNRLAAKDGERAMDMALGQEGMMKMVSAMGAMMGWMRSSPDEAYAWLQENPDELSGSFGMGKEQIEGMYYATLAKKDFEGTMAKLDGMDSELRNTVIGQLAESFGNDEERRNQLLAKLEGDDEALQNARRNIVTQLTWQDPQKALAFIEEQGVVDEERKSLERNVTSMWAQTNPEEAVAWQSGRLQGQEGAGDEIADSFANWLAQDEESAATWLQGQGEEFKTDSVFLQSGAQLANRAQYDRAAAWYEQVLDDNTRVDGYRRVYEQWKGSDGDAANAWLQNLPEADASAVQAAPGGEEPQARETN